MKPHRIRFSIEVDATTDRTNGGWTDYMQEWAENHLYRWHPELKVLETIEPQAEAGDQLNTHSEIEALPQGSAVESEGRLFVRFYDDDQPWKAAPGGEWYRSDQMSMPAVVRFVP